MELIAYILGEVWYEKYKARKFFIFSFLLATLGASAVLVNVDFEDAPPAN